MLKLFIVLLLLRDFPKILALKNDSDNTAGFSLAPVVFPNISCPTKNVSYKHSVCYTQLSSTQPASGRNLCVITALMSMCISCLYFQVCVTHTRVLFCSLYFSFSLQKICQIILSNCSDFSPCWEDSVAKGVEMFQAFSGDFWFSYI